MANGSNKARLIAAQPLVNRTWCAAGLPPAAAQVLAMSGRIVCPMRRPTARGDKKSAANSALRGKDNENPSLAGSLHLCDIISSSEIN